MGNKRSEDDQGEEPDAQASMGRSLLPQITSKKAIASVAFSLLAVFPIALMETFPYLFTSHSAVARFTSGPLSALVYPCLIAALAFGHIARREIRKNSSTLKGARVALFGLILGYSCLALNVIGLATAPIFLRQFEKQDERQVVSSLYEVRNAAAKYYASHSTGYPPTLKAMNPLLEDNTFDADFKAELIRISWYTSGVNSGYALKYVPLSTKPNGPSDAYSVHADPINHESSRPHFYIDQTGILRSERGKEANESSPPVGN